MTMTTNAKNAPALEPLLANCRDYWLGWGAAETADGEPTYYRSDLADGQLNGVLRLSDTTHLEQTLKQTADRMAGLPWMWWVGPDSAPDMATRLVDLGAVKLGTSPIMAIALDRVTPAEGPGQAADLQIETVEGPEALHEWVQSFITSFGVTPQIIDDAARIEAERPDSARITRFAARRDGRVVGTSLLYEAHGVAGVYVVSTAPDHRRQGIGTALSTAALTTGREHGLHIGTLQASPLGALVYPRMGFETVAEYELFDIPTP